MQRLWNTLARQHLPAPGSDGSPTPTRSARWFARWTGVLLFATILCSFWSDPAHAGAPDLTNGTNIYTNVCAGCHGAPPDASNGTYIWQAANLPSRIEAAADCPAPVANYNTEGYYVAPLSTWSCSGMGGDTDVQTDVGGGVANQNQIDIAYYIAQFVQPSTQNLSTSTSWNTATSVDVTNGISGWNTFAGGNSTGVAFGSATYGTISNVSGNTFTYTPYPTSSNVNDVIQFTASNSYGSSSSTVTIHIGTAPAISAGVQNFTVGYETSGNNLTLSVSGAGTITVTAPTTGTLPSGNRITAVSGTTLTFQASTGYTGTDSFSYSIRDSANQTATNTVNVTVMSPAIPAVASPAPAAQTVAFNPPNTGGTSFSALPWFTGIIDSCALGGTGPVNGAVVQNGAGSCSVTYTPNSTYSGTDTFQMTAHNAAGTSGLATITVTIPPPGNPTINAGKNPDNVTATYNNGPPAAATLLDFTSTFGGYVSGLNFTSPTPAGGTLTAVSGQPEQLNYTPPLGYHGTDTFTITAFNTISGTHTSPALTVNVTTNLPASPTASNATFNNVPYDTATALQLSSYVAGVLNTATPITITQLPATGTLMVGATPVTTVPFASTSTQVTYTGNATFYGGTDTFKYQANGPSGVTSSAAATVTVNVNNPPPPTAPNLNLTAYVNTAKQLSVAPPVVSGVITGGIQISTAPAHGTATVTGYTITYTPTSNYQGADSFQYIAVGPKANSTPGTVTVSVVPAPTVAESISLPAALNGPTQFNLAQYITGTFITGVNIISGPAHGTVNVIGTTITYTPTHDFFGSDTFRYTAYGAGGTASGTVTLVITQRPDPTQDPDVAGLVLAEADQARRFSRTQIGNIEARLEALHNGPRQVFTPEGEPMPAPPPAEPAAPGASGSGYSSQRSAVEAVLAQAARQPAQTAPAAVRPLTPDPFADSPVPDSASGPTPGSGSASASTGAATTTADAATDPSWDSGAPARTGAHAAAAAVPAPLANAGTSAGGSATQNLNGSPTPSANTPVGGVGQSLPGVTPAGPYNGPGNPVDVTAMYGSFNLNMLSHMVLGAQNPVTGVGTWASGSLNFGNTQANGNASTQKFDTDGVTFGADKRLAEDLAVGVALGYARDRTDVGTDGTQSRATGGAIALYASYQVVPAFFLDAVLGFGNLRFDSVRTVAPIDATAAGHRTGEQAFASVTAGYDYRQNELLVAPYARVDVTEDRLNAYTESGASQYDLTYEKQSLPTDDAAFGLKVQLAHEVDFGTVLPYLRLEYAHDFQKSDTASIAYADLFNTRYSLAGTEYNRNSVTAGMGVDFVLSKGLDVGLDYAALRSFGSEGSQEIRLRLSQQLDGGILPSLSVPNWGFNAPLGLRADMDYTYDDNVTRNDGTDRLSDQAYDLNLARPLLLTLTENTRIIVTPTLGFEKWHVYGGLDHVSMGGKAELQYRSDGEFTTPTYAVILTGSADEFNSWERRGDHYSLGFSATKPVTDVITAFGALSFLQRDANSHVWDDRETSLRFNLDYALSSHATLYGGAEYRRGDSVSVGAASLEDFDVSSVLVRDDTFSTPDVERFAYRFRANTYLLTFGYNLALGERDALDFSYRWIRTAAAHQPTFTDAEAVRYTDNQITIVYLVRF